MKDRPQPPVQEQREALPPLRERIVYQAVGKNGIDAKHAEKPLPKPLISIFNTIEAIEQQREEPLDPDQARKVVLLTAMWQDPDHFQSVAEVLKIPEQMSWTLVAEAHRDEITKKMAETVFDMSQKKKKPENDKQLSVSEIVDNLVQDINEILPPRAAQIVKFVNEGLSNEEIAKRLGIQTNSVAIRLAKARKAIEQKVLTPNGIFRISSFPFKTTYIDAVEAGRIEGRMFLRLWYAKERDLYEYGRKFLRQPDEAILHQGYVLLDDIATPRERNRLYYEKYKDVVLRHGNRLYIKPEDLERFRIQGFPPRQDTRKPPVTGYVPLSIATIDKNEYQRTLNAIKTGKLPAEKTDRGWFIKPEILEEYRAKPKRYKKGYYKTNGS